MVAPLPPAPVPDPGPPDPGPRTAFSPLDHALFEAYLLHGISRSHLSTAANNPNLSTLDILAWLALPHIAAARAALLTHAREAAELRRALGRFNAVHTLDHLCSAKIDPTERRRAASTLLGGQPLRGGSASPSPMGATSGVGSFGTPSALHNEPLVSSASPSQMGARSGVGSFGTPRASHNEPQVRSESPSPMGARSGVGSFTTDRAETPAELSEPDPAVCVPLAPHTADSAIPPTSNSPPIPLTTFITNLNTQFAQRAESNLDAETDNDSDADSDAENDAFATAIEAHLGVPLTHPRIIEAVYNEDFDALDAIAADIRARDPTTPRGMA